MAIPRCCKWGFGEAIRWYWPTRHKVPKIRTMAKTWSPTCTSIHSDTGGASCSWEAPGPYTEVESSRHTGRELSPRNLPRPAVLPGYPAAVAVALPEMPGNRRFQAGDGKH